jgi:hypothetical protein
MKTDTEIRQEGIEPFDYTTWQRGLWADKSIEEISKEAMVQTKQQSE